jgi:hypothetical protein
MNKWIMLAVLLSLSAGCANCGNKCSAPADSVAVVASAPDGSATLEVESFKLAYGKIRDLKGATGGKAVELVDEPGEAEIVVNLPKGDYALRVFGFATSYDADGFYIRVHDLDEKRLAVSGINKVLPTGTIKFTMAEAGPCKVVIAFGEEGVLFDRVEIKPAKK